VHLRNRKIEMTPLCKVEATPARVPAQRVHLRYTQRTSRKHAVATRRPWPSVHVSVALRGKTGGQTTAVPTQGIKIPTALTEP
jgi:hypothetical protein